MDRIPILKLGDKLLVTIQVDFHDRVALALQEDLTEKILSAGAKGVLIDISALEMVDSFMGRVLGNIARASRLLDCETVLVGMQPAIAITITELGIALQGIHTALNAEGGMALLERLIKAKSNRGRTANGSKIAGRPPNLRRG
jgi:rsbT antagonist protein RsbS